MAAVTWSVSSLCRSVTSLAVVELLVKVPANVGPSVRGAGNSARYSAWLGWNPGNSSCPGEIEAEIDGVEIEIFGDEMLGVGDEMLGDVLNILEIVDPFAFSLSVDSPPEVKFNSFPGTCLAKLISANSGLHLILCSI